MRAPDPVSVVDSELERLVDKDFRFEGLTDSVEDGHNYEGETDAAKACNPLLTL